MKISFASLKNPDHIHLQSVYQLAHEGHLNAAGFRHALQLSGHAATKVQAWKTLDKLLLIFGVALVVLGVVFAVAHNWEYLTRLLGSWGKFAVLQLLVFGAFGFAILRGLDSNSGRIALVAAIALIGPLLALFGQTYQTGADTFSLFLTWAGLALAWVLASRNAAAWLLWIVIVQTALVAYIFSNLGWLGLLFGWFTGWQLVAFVNLGLLICWELASRHFAWLHPGVSFSARFSPRLIAWVLLALLTIVTCVWIVFAFETRASVGAENQRLGFGALLWLLAMALGYFFYRPQPDLFMLSAGLVSLLLVIIVAIGRIFFWGGQFGAGLLFFPLIAGLVFFYTSWARRWLKIVSSGSKKLP
jgi:uncharacterized membrane protein